jgi:hypothetical protein
MNNTEQAELLVEKILQSTRGTFEMFGVYIGLRLGYYKVPFLGTTSLNKSSNCSLHF